MVGNGRFDLTSSPDSGFVGSKGSYFGPSFERFGSFREGAESRLFSSGPTPSRASGMISGNTPPLSQCLMLEPIVFGDQKYARLGELKKALGFSAGSSSEENSLGAAHSRPSPPVSFEELKRCKDGVTDLNNKARCRVKKLDEHLHKLNKYVEVVNSKKQGRNGFSFNERSSAMTLKMGVQMHQNLLEVDPQKVEDRAKNVLPNKRVRTSIAETRVECRSNGVARQSSVMAKERDLLKDNCASSVGGEGWDKKMKRKRSVGPSLTRPLDSDGELKRSMHHKVVTESGSQSGDVQGFRPGYANNISGTNKLDASSLPVNSLPRGALKHDQGKVNLVRDLSAGINKAKPLAKGNNGLSSPEENNQIASVSPVPKVKASRAPRSSSASAPNSSLNIPRVLENGGQPSSGNKNYTGGVANNIRKRALPTGSSSPPMAQWVGQRPQKMSRTRRANVVSPVSNHDEAQPSYEGCSPSDLSTKINSGGTSSSLMFRGMANSPQQLKVKSENGSSPAQLSGGEDSGAVEGGLKEKGFASDSVEKKSVSSVCAVVPSLFVSKKNKLLTKEETGDGMRRQGRSGRGSFPTATLSPIREKLDTAMCTKPLRTMRPGSDKNGSKAGRPLKKQVDRKGYSRRGLVPNGSSPDFTGESDDDREELLAAAVSARNAHHQACSSQLWEKVEPIFGPISMLDASYLSQQVKFADELHGSLSQMLCGRNNDDPMHEENSLSNGTGFGEISGRQNQIEPNESAKVLQFADQFQEFDDFCGKLDSERILKSVAPLYQRVLSALILEDEIEELEEIYKKRNAAVQRTSDLACDSEPGELDGMEYESRSVFGAQTQKLYAGGGIFSCNGTKKPIIRSSIMPNPPHKENGYMHAEFEVFHGHFGNDMDEPQVIPRNGFTVASHDSLYEQMCMEEKLLLELQSIGIHLDPVPDLDDGECDALSQEIILLKQGLHKQVCQKKTCLEKVDEALQQGKEAEAKRLEKVGMDKLVELAHKKLLGTRGSIASKYGTAKVSKQVASAFSKRTIARCRAFEESGTSCFNEPALRDAIFAASSLGNEGAATAGDGVRLGSRLNSTEQHNLHMGSFNAFESCAYQSDEAFAKNGPISNRGKKKEVLLDDVGCGTAPRPSLTIAAGTVLGGAKGKRSERERDGNVGRVGRPSLSSLRGERKSKAKPKQKTAQLPTPGNVFMNKFTDTKHQKRESGLVSSGTILTKENEEEEEALDFSALPLPDLDSLDVLGVGNDDLGGGHDLGSLLNFDDLGLADQDSAGLEIPMDDLSELNMF